MDSRSAHETSWDADLLPLELVDLAVLDFDLALTGFEPDELAALLAQPTEGLTDPDEVPDVPEELVSKPGDLYRTSVGGEHCDEEWVRRRLTCRLRPAWRLRRRAGVG